jgi:hypothetical protein
MAESALRDASSGSSIPANARWEISTAERLCGGIFIVNPSWIDAGNVPCERFF